MSIYRLKKSNGEAFATLRSAKAATTRFCNKYKVKLQDEFNTIETDGGFFVDLDLPESFVIPKSSEKAAKQPKQGVRSAVAFKAENKPFTQSKPIIAAANYETSNVLINSSSKEYHDKIYTLKEQIRNKKTIDIGLLQEVALDLNDGVLDANLKLNAKNNRIYIGDVKSVLRRCDAHLMALLALDLNTLLNHLKNGSISLKRVIDFMKDIHVPPHWYTQPFRQARRDLKFAKNNQDAAKILTLMIHTHK